MSDTCQLKSRWKKELASMAGKKGWVTKRQISQVTGIPYSTITDDIYLRGKISNVVKAGEEESKGRVRIPLSSALEYIESYQVVNPTETENTRPPLDQLRQRSLFDQ